MAKKQAIDIVVRAHDEASRKLRQMGGATHRFSGILKKAAAAAGAYFGARMIVDAIAAQIRAAEEYEHQIAEISTMLSGEGMKALETYRVGVKRMAIQFGQSTEVMSKGMYDILSAGISAGGAMEVLEIASRAAIGGMTDTAVAVDGITTVLNAYRLSASKASHVSDVMFAIVKAGKINYTQLAENIGKVAPTAKVAGMSLENLGAMIATLVTVEKPERAMTALTAAMMHAAKEGENVLDLVRRFEGRSLDDIVGAGISKRAATAVAMLAQNFDVLNKNLEQFKNVGGAAEKAYAKMADTVIQKEKEIRAQWETSGVIGEELKGYKLMLMELYGLVEKKLFDMTGKGDAGRQLQELWKMPKLEFAGGKGIIEDTAQLEERLAKVKKIRQVFIDAAMEEHGKDPKTLGWVKLATDTWREMAAQMDKYKGKAAKELAYQKQLKEWQEKRKDAAAARVAQEAQWEKSAYDTICQRHADEMNLEIVKVNKEADVAQAKKKADEDEEKRRAEMMKNRAKQIKEAVMTPVERFKQKRAELTEMLGAGMLDEEQFGRALQAALKRAGKTTEEWPITQQLAAYESRFLTRGRGRDRNDPAMQQVRIQQDIAKNTDEQKKLQTETRDLIRQLATRSGLKVRFAEIG